MTALLVAFGLFLAGGAGAVIAGRSGRWAMRIGAWGAMAGSALAAVPAVRTLAGFPPVPFSAAWSMPGGSMELGLDALSAVFLLPIVILGFLSAVYSLGYLNPDARRGSVGLHGLWFNVLVASMVLVVLSRNGLLFLLAWEGMALSSYFLVNFEDDRDDVRSAGYTYLVATHLGTAFLLILFTVLGAHAGSLDFARWTDPPAAAGLLFVLALIGFGAKAGIVPLHVWLPEAHPSAPSHVSALMSGAMVKMGIYGLLRFLAFLGPPEWWWGLLLIGIGLSSGILGVLFALAQHDLKRLLAYSTVENVGIIILGIGLGVLGLASGSTPLAVLGFAGALLHVVNHALFKGLLFLGAGAVLHSSGTREMDELGGLMRRMPWTGVSFVIGAAAISALPPLNGFVSEFLIYLGAFRGIQESSLTVVAASAGSIALLGLIGGLAAACFTKAAGSVFLGQPRSAHARGAHPTSLAMRLPMVALAAGCLGVGLAPALVVPLLAPAVRTLSGLPLEGVRATLVPVSHALAAIAWAGLGLLVLTALLVALRSAFLRGRDVRQVETWGCGYHAPTARMQYTSSSFAQPLVDLGAPVLRTIRHERLPSELFPTDGSFETVTPDVFRRFVFEPVFRGVGRGARRLKGLQGGQGRLYVLYLLVTLAVLLVWRLGLS